MKRAAKLLIFALALSVLPGSLVATEPPEGLFHGSLVGYKYKQLSKGDVIDVYFIRAESGTWFGRFMYKNRRKLFSGIGFTDMYAWTPICKYDFTYAPVENEQGLFEEGSFTSKDASVETSLSFSRVWDDGWNAMGHIYGLPIVDGDQKKGSVMCNFTSNFNYDIHWGHAIQKKGVKELVDFVAKRNGFLRLYSLPTKSK